MSRIDLGYYAGGSSRQHIRIMISLIILIAQLDPSIAEVLRRSLVESPYGMKPPEYMFTPIPESQPDVVVETRRPIVCNNQTEFECICVRPFISTHPSSTNNHSIMSSKPDCSVFIKTDELPVVDMRMRHVNTEAIIHSGISYEEYFKKRIASIVSHYCQHNTNECPGTTLRTSQVSQEYDNDEIDKSVLYAERDESEPLLNKENVVILRMEQLRGNVTRILFVVTKNDRVGGIVSENLIIDPIKVKYILASQVGPLSRVLGGIRIDSVRAAKLKRNENLGSLAWTTPEQRADNLKSNSKLIKGLLVVCAFFLTTYCIAFAQCIRYFYRKRQAERLAKISENGLAATAERKNYGTCENQRKPSRNGHVKTEERVPLTYEQIDENANDEPQPLTERQMRNWFACDASQLPREPTIDDSLMTYEVPHGPVSSPKPTEDLKTKEESPILTKREAPKVVEKHSPETAFPPSDEFTNYVEDQYHKSRTSSQGSNEYKPKSPVEDPWDELPKNVPPVVLLQSETPDIPVYPTTIDEGEDFVGKLGGPSTPLIRPRSRRGSRIDEEEGTLDIPELKPLSSDDPLKDPMDVPVPPEQIKTEIEESDRWSSSEDGEVDVYYKMSDDEDVTQEEIEFKKALAKVSLEKQEKPKKQETPPSSPIRTNNNIETDSEDEDEDVVMKEKEDEAFVYERLREELSPQPPIVVDLDTTDLDLNPIKAMPPPPPGMFPESPPESGSDNFNGKKSTEYNSSDDEDSLR
ncbi:unnamed protein product [Caenorhabditis bovis]|uniref:Uncharacterized protein n=1 Tax=Caenorhabditis bovis TaxID=2654633 RepID=A0A8S1ELT0_9PELO|nr:unnamed protein product [Caenorhabditis bovis]